MAITWTLPICAKLPHTCKAAWQGWVLPSGVRDKTGCQRVGENPVPEGVQAWDWKRVDGPCLSS